MTEHVDYGQLSDEARELILFSENDEPLYRMDEAIKSNLDRIRARGVYDRSKAPKAWGFFVEAAAKKYVKEFGGGSWHQIFSPAARKEAAEFIARAYDHEVAGGQRPAVTARTRRSR